MAAINHHEARARRIKVDALVKHIAELCDCLNLTAERDGEMIAGFLRGWGDREWASACVNVGKPKASIETRLAVIAHFQNKARRSA